MRGKRDWLIAERGFRPRQPRSAPEPTLFCHELTGLDPTLLVDQWNVTRLAFDGPPQGGH